jgi:hypothetical protein
VTNELTFEPQAFGSGEAWAGLLHATCTGS